MQHAEFFHFVLTRSELRAQATARFCGGGKTTKKKGENR
jgi:hypothetical protein